VPPPRILYTFRQLYGENPWHVLLQVLPLLAPVLDEIKATPDAAVLATSGFMKRMLMGFLPAERVIHSDKPIASDQVRVVVGSYDDETPFSARTHIFASGCLSSMRQGPAPTSTPSASDAGSSSLPWPSVAAPRPPPQGSRDEDEHPVLLFLPRTRLKNGMGLRHAGAGVRAISNVAELLERTARVLKANGGSGTGALSSAHPGALAGTSQRLKLLVYEYNTLSQQAKSFARARVVVGPDGTAFSGLAFARPGVAVVQWSFDREGAALFTNYLFHTEATFFKLWPRWRRDTSLAGCNSSRLSWNGCPWHLLPPDLRAYETIIAHLAKDSGRELLSQARSGLGGAEQQPLVRSDVELRRAIRSSQVYLDADGKTVKPCVPEGEDSEARGAAALPPACQPGDRAVDQMR
jgi:hypothetical protein